MQYPTIDELQKKVRSAIECLLRRDKTLLLLDVNERSISHKLASYLQDEFGDAWDVDCEYNRNHDITKTLIIAGEFVGKVPTDDASAQTVFPDIIVHHRDTDENALVIEMKKTSNAQGRSFDLRKLRAFKEQFHYKHTLYLQLKTGATAGVDKEIWDTDE